MLSQINYFFSFWTVQHFGHLCGGNATVKANISNTLDDDIYFHRYVHVQSNVHCSNIHIKNIGIHLKKSFFSYFNSESNIKKKIHSRNIIKFSSFKIINKLKNYSHRSSWALMFVFQHNAQSMNWTKMLNEWLYLQMNKWQSLIPIPKATVAQTTSPWYSLKPRIFKWPATSLQSFLYRA